MLARGDEALPYALELARSKDSEFRETGSYLLGQLRKNPEVVRVLLEQLARETDDVARDTTVLALGDLRDKRAIPALAGIIRDEGADGDTRHTAAESLGKIVRKRFGSQGRDVIADALAWLDQDGS